MIVSMKHTNYINVDTSEISWPSNKMLIFCVFMTPKFLIYIHKGKFEIWNDCRTFYPNITSAYYFK